MVKDREARHAAVHGVAKSWTRLSDFTFTFHFHAVRGESQGRRDRGAWWTAVSGVAQSQTRLKRLSSSSSSILITQLPPSAKAKGSYRLHGPQTVNNDGLFKVRSGYCKAETELHNVLLHTWNHMK